MVRRPDLFAAVCCAVPLLDMKAYNTLLAGASWMAEYGNPDVPEVRKLLVPFLFIGSCCVGSRLLINCIMT
jgi:prolyl oligopeptidase PreP (S9A serine peptidase family)